MVSSSKNVFLMDITNVNLQGLQGRAYDCCALPEACRSSIHEPHSKPELPADAKAQRHVGQVSARKMDGRESSMAIIWRSQDELFVIISQLGLVLSMACLGL